MMTPLQADMTAATLAAMAAIHASEAIDKCNDDPILFEHEVSLQCRKTFRAQLTTLRLVGADPRRGKRTTGANNRHAPAETADPEEEPTT